MASRNKKQGKVQRMRAAAEDEDGELQQNADEGDDDAQEEAREDVAKALDKDVGEDVAGAEDVAEEAK